VAPDEGWVTFAPPKRVRLGPSPSLVLYDVDTGVPLLLEKDFIPWDATLRTRLNLDTLCVEILAMRKADAREE
jgi:hypothetical protein